MKEIKEKQEALDSMKKELDKYTDMQRLFEQGGDTNDPNQVKA